MGEITTCALMGMIREGEGGREGRTAGGCQLEGSCGQGERVDLTSCWEGSAWSRGKASVSDGVGSGGNFF
jgi:hypothetical protein